MEGRKKRVFGNPQKKKGVWEEGFIALQVTKVGRWEGSKKTKYKSGMQERKTFSWKGKCSIKKTSEET